MRKTKLLSGLSRWRALLGLLWIAAGWRMAVFGALILVAGVMPSLTILLTGSLVHAVPAAVRHGLDSAGGRPAVLALALLVLTQALSTVAGTVAGQMTRTINTRFALEVYRTLARVTLGTDGVAPLEDPGVANEVQRIQDADRRGVPWQTATRLSSVAVARLTGIATLVVLFGFRWWAPFAMAAAWLLAGQVMVRGTARGVSMDVSDGAVRQRRAEYLRALVLEPGAAKENRVFGLGSWMVGRYSEAWQGALRLMWSTRAGPRGLTAAASLALLAAHGLVLGALAAAAARGEVDVAHMVVFVQATLASSSVGLIGEAQWWLGQSLLLAQRLADLRSRAGDRYLAAAPAAALPAAGGPRAVAVRLDEVRFTYRSREVPVLDGLSLEIPAGQSLAIVGENGAGKSTLIKLLCGLYEPDEGRVSVDGLPPRQARGRIGVIFQDFVRYKLPLRENVAFGHLPLLRDTAALEAALRDAGGAALLARLPLGWDTVLSREFAGGADLSGGEWQRVALARALAAVRGGAGLLILDEPTASLDVRAETELFERFLELTRGVTTILVSHRLSSVRRADRIVVLDGGRLAEDGTHDQLMAARGRYAALFTLQAERFAASGGPARGEEVVHA
jgi:ATP-binding cassette subfamily B protein